jgi:serine/threonine-protein kinase
MLLWSLAGTYIAAFMATIPVKIIRRLGRQVTRARELGSYRLEELLGRGGMGEVYRASHRLLARPAAIKLILPEVLGERGSDRGRIFVERFRREADAAASLRSPHTIELYDFGVTDDGTFFYVMEYLDGVDLETLVQRYGPLPSERAIRILQQACESLAEAHAKGLVHRDIKPSNIHVCRLGLQVDFVKVLDFGLVKTERPEDADITQVTSPQVVTGTPAFMAPEAVLDHDTVDRRADIYALGCVGYWLLTGATVFEADTTMKMLLQQVQNPAPPPSRRAVHAVPEELDAIVLACLAKARSERPADGAELARRLAAVPLREAWTDARAEAWWEEHLPAGRAPVPPAAGEARTATVMHAPTGPSSLDS